MNKTELTEFVAEQANISKTAANTAVDSVLAGITQGLQKDAQVALTGFGTFTVRERPEREGRNPRTGEPLQIAAKKVAGFKPGNTLKEAVQV